MVFTKSNKINQNAKGAKGANGGKGQYLQSSQIIRECFGNMRF
jgi:hypothetical protein